VRRRMARGCGYFLRLCGNIRRRARVAGGVL
jgi:hypothetical protein